MQADDGTSGEPLPYLLILYSLIISQGNNVRRQIKENREKVTFQITEDNSVSDACLFHIRHPALLIMIRFDTLYLQDIFVPGNNHDQLAP